MLIFLLLLACGTPEVPPQPEPVQRVAPEPALPALPAGPGAQAPSVFTHGTDVLLTWFEPEGEGHALRWSRLRDNAWSAPITIASGADLFVNWADTPQITRGGDDGLYVSFPRKSAGADYAYDVVISRSMDDGWTWTELGSPHHDGTPTEHGFVSLVPNPTGVDVVWLDGRAMADGGAMALRTATAGEVFGAESVLDDRVCDCCGTATAQTFEGPVVVYRDRSEGEIRDLGVVRRMGTDWSAPGRVHADAWEIAGCPVNGPRVVARGRDVSVAWFSGSPEPSVKLAHSRDGGRAFAAPLVVSDADTIGRVELLTYGKADLVMFWMDALEGDRAALRARRFHRTGRTSAAIDVAEVSAARGTGFPRAAVVGDGLWVVWTDPGTPSTLRQARVPFERFPLQ